MSNEIDEKNRKYDKRIEELIVAFLFIVISFSNSGNFIARGALYVLFIGTIIILPLLRKGIYLYHKKIIKSVFILVIYNFIIIFFKFENYDSIYNGLLYSASILFFVSLISGRYKINSLNSFTRYLSTISKFLILVNFGFIIIDKTLGWVSSTSFIFLFLYFIYLDNKTSKQSKVVFSMIWIVTAIYNEARTFVLLVPVFLVIYFYWNKLSRSFNRYKLIFYIVAFLLFVIPIIYIWLSESSYAYVLNKYALRYTNSRFFSSRDLIWSQLLNNYYAGDVLFGGGHHISPKYVFTDLRSSHNTYVSVLTRTGIVGSVLFLNLLKNVWVRYYEFKSIPAVKLSAIFFLISLLKQSSELSLISNNIAVSVMNWLVIAYGLMYTNSIIYEKRGKV